MLPVSRYLIKFIFKKSVAMTFWHSCYNNNPSAVIPGGLFIMSSVAGGYGMYNVWLLCTEILTAEPVIHMQ